MGIAHYHRNELQAADLLKQLYDFVIFTHNRRFQIDVQDLQALLYDSRGESRAALESLTHALQLAEPGDFIRPFVDLGPQMANQKAFDAPSPCSEFSLCKKINFRGSTKLRLY